MKCIKEELKYIVIATDKNLGSVIVEIEYYIHQCLNDHLDKKDTCKELTKIKTLLLNEEIVRFIYTHFIDNSKAIFIKQALTFFIRMSQIQRCQNRYHLEIQKGPLLIFLYDTQGAQETQLGSQTCC